MEKYEVYVVDDEKSIRATVLRSLKDSETLTGIDVEDPNALAQTRFGNRSILVLDWKLSTDEYTTKSKSKSKSGLELFEEIQKKLLYAIVIHSSFGDILIQNPPPRLLENIDIPIYVFTKATRFTELGDNLTSFLEEIADDRTKYTPINQRALNRNSAFAL